MNIKEENLYKKEELMLKEDQCYLLAFKKDVAKVPISRKLKTGQEHQKLIEKEYSYYISKEVVRCNSFYRSQLPHARYVKWLYILNEQKQVVQKVPVFKVIQTRRGGLMCCIDRRKFTEEMIKHDSIQKN
ncbi:hypothetical protein HQ862_12845 [Enterococcus faecium]|nr:hypothetical protein [Enterococcus faecium]